MNEDELRETLRATVPATPETSGWADAARRRSRRTRGILAGGAVLVVGLVAAVAVTSLRPGAVAAVPAAPGTTSPATSATSGAAEAGCAGYSEATGGDVPADALALRLCPTGYAALQFAPLDALDVAGAHSVLAVLRQQPRLGTRAMCRADLGSAFLLVAEYSGREPVVMDLQLYGCGLVGTTTDRRNGAEEVLAAFRAALAEQRAQSPRSLVRSAPLCPPQAWEQRLSVMPVHLAEVTGGTLCGYESRTGGRLRERQLDTDALSRVIADLAANSSPSVPVACPAPRTGEPAFALALTTRWGDVLAIVPDGCPGSYGYQLDGEGLRWQPDAEVAELLGRLGR